MRLSRSAQAVRRVYPASTGSSVSIDIELPAVAQRRRDGVDRQMYALPDPRIVLARPVTLEQFHLQQIQRFDVGQPQPDGGVQGGILFEQVRLSGDAEQALLGGQPGIANAAEQRLSACAILDQG